MSQLLNLLDLPTEVRGLVWKHYFQSFDLEVIQHMHVVDRADTLESTVRGFGPSQDLSILRISSAIHQDTQEFFMNAFSGHLRVLGCQVCQQDGEGRLFAILNTMPVRLLRSFTDFTTTTCYCLDKPEHIAAWRKSDVGHTTNLRRFPMLERLITRVDSSCLDLQPAMMEELQKLRLEGVRYDEQETRQQVLAARRLVVEKCSTDINFAFELLSTTLDGANPHWLIGIAKQAHDPAECIPILVEYIELRDARSEDWPFFKNFETYLVSRISRSYEPTWSNFNRDHDDDGIYMCEVVERPKFDWQTTCRTGDVAHRR